MDRRAMLFAVVGLMACTEPSTTVPESGLRIQVAPLTLPDVADACYDLAVYNVDSTAIAPSALVWSRAGICADRFGDGRGAISYVGTCDASPSGRPHTISLVLNGLCNTNGCDVGDDADPGTIPSDTYRNPCPAASPCLLERPCAENADTLVAFNLTIMREANQGFFDVAVNFDTVFCSAKLDCVPELLHRPGADGARDLTAVLGFACTSGAADTCLYATAVTLDCGNDGAWTIDPSQGPGNVPVDGALLFGAAVYNGDEGFTAFRKSYWNIALGLDETRFDVYPNCTLRWMTTASEQPLDGIGPFTTPANSTYPVIGWERDIIVDGVLDCGAHPLNATLEGEDGPSVATGYTPVDTPASFLYTNCPPDAGCACPDGFTLNANGDGCARVTTATPTLSATVHEVCAGGSDEGWSADGTRFSTSLAPADFEIPPDQNTTTTCTDPTRCIAEPTLGIGTLSTVGVWTCGAGPEGVDIGFSRCFDLATGGVYLVGAAGDNHVRLEIGGAVIYQSVSPAHFRTWNVLRVPLDAGQHTLELFGRNDGGPAAFGAEIWGPFEAADVATPALMRDAWTAAINTPGQPLRVFSTQPMRSADPTETFDTSGDGSSGWVCPTTNFDFNLCASTPTCTLNEMVSCLSVRLPPPAERLQELPTVVPTYHSLSIYWNPNHDWTPPSGWTPTLHWTRTDMPAPPLVSVRYRVTGEDTWHNGYPMRYWPIAHPVTKATYRGSLVNLRPGTSYDIALEVGSGGETVQFTAATRSEEHPVATAVKVGSRGLATANATPLVITGSGTEDGYVLYDGTGSTIDLDMTQDHGIEVNASYVILRGFTIRNIRQHGIRILGGHHIVIEDCDISQWGEESKDSTGAWTGFGVNLQSGIYSNNKAIHAVTVQRCRIHHPNEDANNWEEMHLGDKHPKGPQAISFRDSAGNHVIRYNECWSDPEHFFHDVLGHGGARNEAFPGPDSDIHGNYLASAHDDGIEMEGGAQNVRVWNNMVENTYVGLGNAPVGIGPLFVWRNVFGTSVSPTAVSGYAVKMGWSSEPAWMTGHMYLFNNTVLNTAGSIGGGRDIRHSVTRNNIFNPTGAVSVSVKEANRGFNDYDFDLLSGLFPTGPGGGTGPESIAGTPIYAASPADRFSFETMNGQFQQAPGSPGLNEGTVIANFCETWQGSGVDIGAHEEGTPPMVFGVNAFFNPPPTHIQRIVDAFPATQNVLPTGSAILHGRADWLTPDPIVVAWSVTSGPGAASFSAADQKDTTAVFTAPGIYVLRFTASDSGPAVWKEVTVIVKDNALPTATIIRPVPQPAPVPVGIELPLELVAGVSDDGLPNGPPTVKWAKASGPGNVVFTSDELPTTQARFSALGTYTLQVTVCDGAMGCDVESVVVAVQQSQAPVIQQALPVVQTIARNGTATLKAIVTQDDGLPGPLEFTWWKTHGPATGGDVIFADPKALSTTATFTAPGTYTIRVRAFDGLFTVRTSPYYVTVK